MPLPTPKEVRFADPDVAPYPTPGIPVWGASTVRQERVSVQMSHTEMRDVAAEPSPTSDALPSAVEGTTLSSDLAAEYVETITEDVSTAKIGKEVRVPYLPVRVPEAAPRSTIVFEEEGGEEEEVQVTHSLPIGGDVGQPRITHIFEESLHPGYGEGNAGEVEFGHEECELEHEHEDAVELHEDITIDRGHGSATSFAVADSAPAPHVQHAPFDAHGTVATPAPYTTGKFQKTRAPRPTFDYDAEPQHALGVSAAPAPREGNAASTCRCEIDSGRRDVTRTVPTPASAPAAGFSVRFDCNVSELRTVALALVDDEYCGGEDIDVLIWKIVHITPGGFCEVYEFTGEFGVAVQKYSSTYYSRSVNRLGSLTRITNRGSTVIIHNPEHICDRSRQMRIRNESDDYLDVSIGVVTCEKVFQPLIRHRELPIDEELVTGFSSLSLKAFFIEPGTEECSLETGQFGAIPLDTLGSSVKSRVVKIDMHERNGKFRAVMH
ncbi:hypothetical protein AURDEDRAFT_111620 [Auricularia subglabra TFB-10046 SS5]|nr:hypothetical protein AURDEDRAFT_111620 [Auricularia subglabra TFB-10046 SS5]